MTKNNAPTAAEKIQRVLEILLEAQDVANSVPWTESDCTDDQLGKHLLAFGSHIGDARGRAAAVLVAVRRSNRTSGVSQASTPIL